MDDMTDDELERIHREAFGVIRQNSDPSVWPLVDAMQKTLELTAATVEAMRARAALLDGLLGARLATVGRNDD